MKWWLYLRPCLLANLIITTFQEKTAVMKMNKHYSYCKFLGVVSFPLSVAMVASLGDIAQAQIIPDETLGTESSVVAPLNGQADRIDGGAARGSNLFHSFREFNINEGRGAYFANPAVIENIFSRVTGSNSSRLLGTLGVLGDANLFFLNPNGIIFGKNASLDIRGSLVTSTANSLLFPDGDRFSATNPQAPPLLEVDAPIPIGLQFEGDEVGAIINAGELEAGGNLTLVVGTVASTGQLSAPEGEVAVSTVSGVEAEGNLAAVQLGEAGQISGQEMQPLTGGSNQTEKSTLSWSGLVADGGDETGLTINDEGKVELIQSGTPVSAGDITINQLIAQGAKLSATNNLTLVESQLGTVGDLTLLAQDTVRVRDSVENPFIAAAEGELLVQGNQEVDIFALNHPESGLFSGGALVLRSANSVGGDAHYWSGGDFRIEQLDGSLGNLFSPNDPIIRSQGDVSFNIYRGTSLHILAGGSVDIGTAIITEPETGTVESDFIEENVRLSDGTEISINGSVQPTLDIRAGITAEAVGFPEITGFDDFPIDFFADSTFSFLEPPPDVTTSATSADITIGDVFIDAPNGLVFITNQYQPNTSLTGGDITVTGAGFFGDGIDAHGFGGDGGNVILDSRSGITLTDSFIVSSSDVGNAGNTTLLAKDTVSLKNGGIFSQTFETGQGGDITIDTGQLLIQNGSRVSASTIGEGDAGNVMVNASESDIMLTDSQIIASSDVGNSGDITLLAKDTVSLKNSDILSEISETGQAGDIKIDTGQLLVQDGSWVSTSTYGKGNAGNIIVNASESVEAIGVSPTNSLKNSLLIAITEGTGEGGDITITTPTLLVRDGAGIQGKRILRVLTNY